MNLTETLEEAEFRATVRTWLAREITPMVGPSLTFSDRVEADIRLAAAGYLGYTWPKEFGGADGDPILASILDEECARAGIPRSLAPSRFGAHLLAPALIAHGTHAQLEEFLPPIRSAKTIWCQGFSETEAGSDLANVQSFAADNGDHLILNGSKIWTTQAHEADWCFALVRTSRTEPRHHNLSFVLFNMRQENISIRPIKQLTGQAEFNEVRFDDVRIERRHVIGDLDEGWQVAMTVVGAERSYGQLSRFSDYTRQLRAIAALVMADDSPRTGVWLTQIGQLAADLTGIRDISYKLTSLAAAGMPIGTLPSVNKLWWSTTHQRLCDLGYEVAIATDNDLHYWQEQWLSSRAESIYAGTSQVQRNIIAERMLGLPK